MSFISVYTSSFNLENGLFDWRDSLDRMHNFCDELVIGTTTDSSDRTIELLDNYVKTHKKAKLVITNYLLSSPTFDGDIKNAALQSTLFPVKILLDLDEIAPNPNQRDLWINNYNFMIANGADCLAIPSINLCKSLQTYKDIGYKFYIHRAGLYRGVVDYAKKDDGSIDISKSDTTEVILSNGKLPRMICVSRDINDLQSGKIPYIFHKWAVDLDNRINQNKFWKPVWVNRAKREVDDIILNKSDIEKIEVFEHKLPLE